MLKERNTMSKKSIYVRHQDEIVKELINCHKNTLDLAQSRDKTLREYGSFINKGWIQALEWILYMDKTQEERDNDFRNKIKETEDIEDAN